MGPSHAETSGRFVWLIGTLCASVIALVAVRAPCSRSQHARPTSYERFEHYRPVKRCIDGRWVIAHDRGHQVAREHAR